MARNPFTGFIQHSVCSTTAQILQGRPVVVQPKRLSVGYAGTAPVLRRASRCWANASVDCEAPQGPCFAPLHLRLGWLKRHGLT